MSQPPAAPPPAPRAVPIDWYWLVGFIVGMLAGQSIGGYVGADYEPVGAASGDALGRWAGFGIGAIVGSIVGALAGRLIRRDPITAKWAAATAALFVLIYGIMAACGMLGEVLAGNLGGILGVCLPVVPFVLIGIIFKVRKG